jgi:hypothetical protein
MAQFQYTAVNSAGKKLSGVIGAASEDDARKQLNTFGISLLAIEKVGETPVASVTQEPGTSSELPKFEFEAYDKMGRKVLGTIPASNRYKAFKRLMDEYQFEVSYVVPSGASEEDRLKAKQEGLDALKAEYEAGAAKKSSEQVADEKQNAAFEAKRQDLLQKVDFILNKIKSLLGEFTNDLKPESRKLIQGYIDKLLRIKSSTNLDYIEQTSEELLKKVQDQELFLTKEKMLAERDHLRLEAQKMMAELHARPSEVTLTQNIEEMHNKWVESTNPLLKGIGQFLARFIPTAEEKLLQQKISAIRREIWTYRKIVWTSPANIKTEAQTSLNTLTQERDRLLQELKALKRKRAEVSPEEIPEPLITEELTGFLGWLLAFYLGAYFIGVYVLAKSLPTGNPLPGGFNLLSSDLLRNLLLSIFVWYTVLSLRLEYLRYKPGATLLTLSLGAIVNAALVFNL